MATFLYSSPVVADTTYDYRETNPYSPSTVSWQEIIASTTVDFAGFHFGFQDDEQKDGLVMVGIGGAGSEQILAAYLSRDIGLARHQYIPIHIPAGSRLSVAEVGWTTGGAAAFSIAGVPYKSGWAQSPYTRQDCGPFNLDGTGADYGSRVGLAAPTSSGVKGAWTEVSRAGTYATPNNILNGDSLSYQYSLLGVSAQYETFAQSSSYHEFTIDLAYGSVGSEVIFAADLPVRKQPNVLYYRQTIWMPWDRPAGERISARYAINDIALAAGMSIMLYGLR